MVKFAFAVSASIVNAVVDKPILLGLWIDLDTVDDADTFDDAMNVATVLTVD
jgi:hypothetical protein